MQRLAKSSVNGYTIGYKRPPAAFQFPKGVSGNPDGKGKRPKAPNLKTQLQSALHKTVSVRIGNRQRTFSKGAAGIEQLVDQWAKGDRNARRDLIALCHEFGIDLTDREALEGALEEALSAEDEALLADFVKRHGGQYPLHGDGVVADPAQDAKLLASPDKNTTIVSASPQNSLPPQGVQSHEKTR